MIPVAVDGGVRDEVVQVRVVREVRGIGRRAVVVHELSEEPERVLLRESSRTNLAELHLHGRRLVVEQGDGGVQLALEELERVPGRQPVPQRILRCAPHVAKLGARAGGARWLVHEHEVRREVVHLLSPAVQICGSLPDRLVGDGLRASGRHDRIDRSFDQVLIDATTLVEQPQCRFHAVCDVTSLPVGQSLVVNALEPVNDADVTGLCQERRVVHKPPEGEQAVDAPGVVVIAKDPGQSHHCRTSRFTHTCLPGS